MYFPPTVRRLYLGGANPPGIHIACSAPAFYGPQVMFARGNCRGTFRKLSTSIDWVHLPYFWRLYRALVLDPSVCSFVRPSVRPSVRRSVWGYRTHQTQSPSLPPRPLFLASLSADNEQLIWHSCSRALLAFLLVNFLDTLNIYVRIDSRTDIPIPVSSTFRMINRKINIKWACFVDGLFRF